MIKSGRIFFGVAVFFTILAVTPLPKIIALKSASYSALEKPLGFSRDAAQVLLNIVRSQKNTEELRLLKNATLQQKLQDHQVLEIRLENERLTRLLSIRRILPPEAGNVVYARVIGRSPSAFNRIFLIDKGVSGGIRVNQPVLSDQSLVGKIIEAGPSVSKVLLLTDPNSRVGVLIQRTRQQGVLYGTVTGECRIKYLSVDARIQPQDVVESAGFGGFFPKGLLIGRVVRAWKEPGQIYQVAEVRPATDFSRIEEVACYV